MKRRGEFLQMSGINVVYNTSQPVGQRVNSVRVLCNACRFNNKYVNLDRDRIYTIVITKYLQEGGDNYSMFMVR